MNKKYVRLEGSVVLKKLRWKLSLTYINLIIHILIIENIQTWIRGLSFLVFSMLILIMGLCRNEIYKYRWQKSKYVRSLLLILYLELSPRNSLNYAIVLRFLPHLITKTVAKSTQRSRLARSAERPYCLKQLFYSTCNANTLPVFRSNKLSQHYTHREIVNYLFKIYGTRFKMNIRVHSKINYSFYVKWDS